MKPYQTLNRRYVIENPWFRLRQDDIILPDGQQVIYNVITKSDAVWIVPVLTDGQVVLINQYRYAIDAWCLEVPAGGIHDSSQKPEEVARQELLEEIGGQAEALISLGTFWTMNGIGDELGHLFLATGVTLSGSFQHEATEFIELKIVPARQAIDMARSGQIRDAQSALALLLCADRLV